MAAAWDIYAEQLISLGYGHPQWFPEPCPDAGEIRIGDVGYLRKGRFFRIFNAMLSANDPINTRNGVPQSFEMFEPPGAALSRLPNIIT